MDDLDFLNNYKPKYNKYSEDYNDPYVEDTKPSKYEAYIDQEYMQQLTDHADEEAKVPQGESIS